MHKHLQLNDATPHTTVALYFTPGLVSAAVVDAMTAIKGSFDAYLNISSFLKLNIFIKRFVLKLKKKFLSYSSRFYINDFYLNLYKNAFT